MSLERGNEEELEEEAEARTRGAGGRPVGAGAAEADLAGLLISYGFCAHVTRQRELSSLASEVRCRGRV